MTYPSHKNAGLAQCDAGALKMKPESAQQGTPRPYADRGVRFNAGTDLLSR